MAPQIVESEAEIVVRLGGGTAQQIERARAAVKDLVMRIPKQGRAVEVRVAEQAGIGPDHNYIAMALYS